MTPSRRHLLLNVAVITVLAPVFIFGPALAEGYPLGVWHWAALITGLVASYGLIAYGRWHERLAAAELRDAPPPRAALRVALAGGSNAMLVGLFWVVDAAHHAPLALVLAAYMVALGVTGAQAVLGAVRHAERVARARKLEAIERAVVERLHELTLVTAGD